MSKTIYLSTPTNSRKGQFAFVYSPIKYTIITSNIFEYKQALSILAELSIIPLELNSDLLEIYIYEPGFKILDVLKQLQSISINITKDLHEWTVHNYTMLKLLWVHEF